MIGTGRSIALSNPARFEPSLPAKVFAGREPERGALKLESNKIAVIHNQRLLSPALSSAARKRGSLRFERSLSIVHTLPTDAFNPGSWEGRGGQPSNIFICNFYNSLKAPK